MTYNHYQYNGGNWFFDNGSPTRRTKEDTMAEQKINRQIENAVPSAKVNGSGSNSDRLTQSPRAIREGNA
ncbi:MAG: hypothetical protein WKF65_10655 [Gaiellaceae bacterium]